MFQSNAFQNPGFQVEVITGGYGDGYAEALNVSDNLRRLKSQINRLPVEVSKPIKRAAKVDSQVERERILRDELSQLDIRITRIYIDLMERLHNAMVDKKIAEMQAEQAARAEYLYRMADDEEAILMILLNFDY